MHSSVLRLSLCVLASAAPLAISADLSAQTQKHAFTPAGTRYWPGGSNNTWPFSGASARYQQIHDAVDMAALNGRRPLIMNSLSFRSAGLRALPSRQWDVQLTVGHTSITAANMTTTFASNFTQTPTQVLPYKTVNVPALPAGSTTTVNPIGWTFPFTGIFLYTPAGGNLCWEWQSKNATSVSTPMDAVSGAGSQGPGIGENAGKGCTATGQAQPATASFVLSSGSFAASLVNARASSGAIMWVGLQRTEVAIPGWCAPLLTVPVVGLTGTTDASGVWSAGSFPTSLLNSSPYFEVYAQYGFLDAALPGGVGLSDLGVVTSIPNQGKYINRMASPIRNEAGHENDLTGQTYKNSGLVAIFGIL